LFLASVARPFAFAFAFAPGKWEFPRGPEWI